MSKKKPNQKPAEIKQEVVEENNAIPVAENNNENEQIEQITQNEPVGKINEPAENKEEVTEKVTTSTATNCYVIKDIIAINIKNGSSELLRENLKVKKISDKGNMTIVSNGKDEFYVPRNAVIETTSI